MRRAADGEQPRRLAAQGKISYRAQSDGDVEGARRRHEGRSQHQRERRARDLRTARGTHGERRCAPGQVPSVRARLSLLRPTSAGATRAGVGRVRQMKNRAARCLAQREACSASRPGAGRGDRTLLAERIIVFCGGAAS